MTERLRHELRVPVMKLGESSDVETVCLRAPDGDERSAGGLASPFCPPASGELRISEPEGLMTMRSGYRGTQATRGNRRRNASFAPAGVQDQEIWQAALRCCQGCGREFTPQRRAHWCCSPRCRVRAHRKRAASVTANLAVGVC